MNDGSASGRTGGPSDPSWQSNVFKEAIRNTGLPVICFHDLRHTSATVLLARGANVKMVSEMLGHSTIKLTLDIYAHLVPIMHQQAVEIWGDVLGVGQ